MPFFVRQTVKDSTKTMPLIPFGSPMAVKRTNLNQRIPCPHSEKTLPLQSKENEKQKLRTNQQFKMKNKLTFPLICGIAIVMAACGGSSNGKPMSDAQLTKYTETAAKVQQVENLLDVIPHMDANEILQLSQLVV